MAKEPDQGWESWDDETFLGYVDTHCDTERALFSRAQVERLFKLADRPLPDVLARSSAGWLCAPREDIAGVIAAARARLAGRAPPDVMTPADIIRARGWWSTCVVLAKRIEGFPGSIDSAEGYPSIAGLGDILRLSDVLARAVKAMPMPSALVIVTFTEGALGYELDAPCWSLEVDGEGEPVTIGEWFGDNRDGLDPETLQEILNLTPGETYAGGGGAAAEWTVRRLP